MENQTLSRRSFFNRLWTLLGTLAFAELIALLIIYFKPRKSRTAATNQDAIIIAGSVDSFEPGTVTAFVRGKFYLARLDDGGFLALSRSCTHLSCTVPWVSGKNRFICPCHSSEFDIRGDVISPPAPRALDLYPVAIENNVIRVNATRPERRSEYAADQIVYPGKT